ncbi:Leucine-rich repeat (LRR) family protein [Rhynchospora pubera]|uniref:Leucine-rich repeat (LRR) family protein n=1 Tax=Rhynchospora pubera TaxID=906938 RepID=A0AAV8ATG6_9POAL|nr:Leucine-rich repeat (LRR) family protein [Rhynchospora pubera]KAJ4752418.1 Leucine-rich repeat (LRR) family protein [Rhynchospora pubera]
MAAPTLVEKCIEAATASAEAVERWRRLRRTLERLPSHLADQLLARLISRKLAFPSLLEVFQYSVEVIDLSGQNMVDGEWLAYLGAFRCLHSLKLADCRGVSSSSIWPLAGMDGLKELDLSRCQKFTDVGVKHIITIESLEKLYLCQTGVTASGVMLLSSLSNLSVLDLGGIFVTDEALSSLQILKKLEHLDLWGSKISDAGATILKAFPRLGYLSLLWTSVTTIPFLPLIKTLNISNCTINSIFNGPCPSGGVPLSKLILSGSKFENAEKALSGIDLKFVTSLDLSGSLLNNLDFLEKMENLEHLNLSFCGIRDTTLQTIAKNGNSLRYLDLKKTKITSYGVSVLAGTVPKLKYLSLASTMIDDSSLSHISMMPSLQTLDLSYTSIKGYMYNGNYQVKVPSACSLTSLNHLESLNLEGIQLKDEAIKPLSKLRNLKYLNLRSEYLSDSSFLTLASISGLKYLGYQGAVLTDSGFLSYVPHEDLKKLDLRDCWLLTQEAISWFCKRYPNIDLEHELVFQVNSKTTGFQNQVKQRRAKKEEPRGASSKVPFADERIRYATEELMQLQIVGERGSDVNLSHIPPELKKTDRK